MTAIFVTMGIAAFFAIATRFPRNTGHETREARTR